MAQPELCLSNTAFGSPLFLAAGVTCLPEIHHPPL